MLDPSRHGPANRTRLLASFHVEADKPYDVTITEVTWNSGAVTYEVADPSLSTNNTWPFETFTDAIALVLRNYGWGEFEIKDVT